MEHVSDSSAILLEKEKNLNFAINDFLRKSRNINLITNERENLHAVYH